MTMADIGQTVGGAQRAVVVIVDDQGQAHAWDVQPVTRARWTWTGTLRGRSTAHIELDGAFRRKTRNIPTDTDPLEIEP